MTYLQKNVANLISFPTLSNHPPPRPIVEKFLEDQNRMTCLSQAQQPQQGLATGLKGRGEKGRLNLKNPLPLEKNIRIPVAESKNITQNHNLSRRSAETLCLAKNGRINAK